MVALKKTEPKVELKLHSPAVARDLNDFPAMAERIAATCKSLLGKTATLKGDNSGDVFTITALYFQVEPTGFHQEVEIARVIEGQTHRLTVDACMLNIDQADYSNEDIEPSDFISLEIPVGDSLAPSAEDTVVLTAKGKEVAAVEPLDPLAELREAVTAHTQLEKRISTLVETALPIGMSVNCHAFGNGVIASHCPSYARAAVEVQFKDLNGGKPMLIALAEVQINNEFLDSNFIPF